MSCGLGVSATASCGRPVLVALLAAAAYSRYKVLILDPTEDSERILEVLVVEVERHSD